MNAPQNRSDMDSVFYQQIMGAAYSLRPDSDFGEIEWLLYQFARLEFADNLTHKCWAEGEILWAIKRKAKVPMRVIRAALLCQQERVARHRRKMEGNTK